MNIFRFLLIDSALVLVGLQLIFFLQGRKRKFGHLRSSNKEELLKEISNRLPDKEKLIEMENLANTQGSGIEFESLLGDWKFISVWKKQFDEEDVVLSSLLRIFSANIEFKEEILTKKLPRFRIITSIKFGVLSIEFSGTGYLKDKQPLLPFFLNLIQLKLGSNIIFSRSIAAQREEEKSFFAMIGLDENGHWLSARGQGGAIVIWLRD